MEDEKHEIDVGEAQHPTPQSTPSSDGLTVVDLELPVEKPTEEKPE